MGISKDIQSDGGISDFCGGGQLEAFAAIG